MINNNSSSAAKFARQADVDISWYLIGVYHSRHTYFSGKKETIFRNEYIV